MNNFHGLRDIKRLPDHKCKTFIIFFIEVNVRFKYLNYRQINNIA